MITYYDLQLIYRHMSTKPHIILSCACPPSSFSQPRQPFYRFDGVHPLVPNADRVFIAVRCADLVALERREPENQMDAIRELDDAMKYSGVYPLRTVYNG